jgi:formylglycine-generating enzyme required for sulfatase activity
MKDGLTPCYTGSGDTITCNFKVNGYRLPTEAEWEYAARGGIKSKGYTFSGSKNVNVVAWYLDNSGNTIHAAAQKKPNELGIYDMSGNAREWCWDWYGPYKPDPQYNPQGPETGGFHVLRGGSWMYILFLIAKEL